MCIRDSYIFTQFGFSIFYLVRFAVKSQNRLVMKQAALFAIGSLVPAVVNLLTTLRIFHLTIAATPIDRKSTRLNSSHSRASRMPSSA